MVVSGLARGLQSLIAKVRGAPILDESLIKTSIKDLQKTLISADVNVRLVLELSKRVEDRMRKEIPRGMSPKQYFIKCVYEEITSLIGEGGTLDIRPQRILLVGLYGHGKTTTAAKLARFFLKRGLKTALITTDTWRPAAFEQLSQLGDKIGVPVYGDPNKSAVPVLKEGLKRFSKYDVIIVDSAGRDSLNEELIDEIKAIEAEMKPDNIYLVMGGDIGQSAEKQAKAFDQAVGLTGIILTRMDSSAKGGGALAACKVAGVPVVFIGTGEGMEDLEIFDPQRFVSRLLGFPDLQALLEKAQEVQAEEDIDTEEILSGKFTLKTFYKQLEATSKMGSFRKVLDMLGLSARIPQELVEQGEEKMKVYKVIMDSMTKEELENPELLNKTRIDRIARGSGRRPEEVRELIKQYKLAKKMMKKMKSKRRINKLPFNLPFAG